MVIVKRSKQCYYKYETVYFAEDYLGYSPDADIIRFFQCSKKRSGAKPFHTLLIDLEKDNETIMAEMHRTTRYEIKRSIEKEEFKVSIDSAPRDEVIHNFLKFNGTFRKGKGLPETNAGIISELRENNVFIVTWISDRNDNILLYHTFITDGHRCRGLHEASYITKEEDIGGRSSLGKANRVLHWYEMLWFKENGYKEYDLGGLTLKSKDKGLLNIDRFKMGFGGRVVTEYHFYEGRTLLGKIVLRIFSRRFK